MSEARNKQQVDLCTLSKLALAIHLFNKRIFEKTRSKLWETQNLGVTGVFFDVDNYWELHKRAFAIYPSYFMLGTNISYNIS